MANDGKIPLRCRIFNHKWDKTFVKGLRRRQCLRCKRKEVLYDGEWVEVESFTFLYD